MNLYRVTLDGWACRMVVAASERQAAGLIADELNWRRTGITFQWSDFDVKEIDINSFRTPTIID